MPKRRALPVALVDLLFTIVIVLIVVLRIPTPTMTSPIDEKAEFLVELIWDDEAVSDIDLWFRGPDGAAVYFGNKQAGLWSLDRDDLGDSNDTQTNPDGTTTVIKVNREVLTMRGWVPGRYTVNVFSFSFRDEAPITATVRLVRLNPFVEEFERQLVFETKGQELTVASFTLDDEGRVSDLSYEPVVLTRDK